MVYPHIYKREKIAEDENRHLMILALMAKAQHEPGATEVTGEEVNDLAYHVFKNWNTQITPRIPVMGKNTVNDSCMLIRSPAQGSISLYLEQGPQSRQTDGFSGWTREDSASAKGPGRRKNKPAFLRASLTNKGQGLVFDYVDVKGKWAPIDFVKFFNGGTRPTPEETALFCQTTDTAHRSIVVQWNRDLCIYLWQWRLYNFTNMAPYNPSALQIREYGLEDFVKLTLISDTIGAMIANLTECQRLMESRPPRE